MWVVNKISKPLREGFYKTLVEVDEQGTLIEVKNSYFDGVEWDVNKAHSQFIIFWFAEKEEYKTLNDKWEKEIDKYLEQKNY